jgi:type VI protein secretion system component Hcp
VRNYIFLPQSAVRNIHKAKREQKVAVKHLALTHPVNKNTNNFFAEICRILIAMHQNKHYEEIT